MNLIFVRWLLRTRGWTFHRSFLEKDFLRPLCLFVSQQVGRQWLFWIYDVLKLFNCTLEHRCLLNVKILLMYTFLTNITTIFLNTQLLTDVLLCTFYESASAWLPTFRTWLWKYTEGKKCKYRLNDWIWSWRSVTKVRYIYFAVTNPELPKGGRVKPKGGGTNLSFGHFSPKLDENCDARTKNLS